MCGGFGAGQVVAGHRDDADVCGTCVEPELKPADHRLICAAIDEQHHGFVSTYSQTGIQNTGDGALGKG
ncbi:hypothetical protein GCM10010409_28240 [Mycolicibacterium diernhoferi]